MMGNKTKAEWWKSVLPYHEQGRKARRDGVPLSGNPLGVPYDTSWAKGWEYEDGFITAVETREAEACKRAREAQSARDTHDCIYSTISEKLSALGIDPYQLRDYLAGLPE